MRRLSSTSIAVLCSLAQLAAAPAPAQEPTAGTGAIAVDRLPPHRIPPLEVDPILIQPAPPGPLGVVGATFEPDYLYPWVVRFPGCAGVLVAPNWVLTAAHCVDQDPPPEPVFYRRTDPLTGVTVDGRQDIAGLSPLEKQKNVHIHPTFHVGPFGVLDDDVALVRIAPGFSLDPYIQTVAIPDTPVPPGVTAVLASTQQHDRPIPAGQAGTFRTPLPATDAAKFEIRTTAQSGSLCPGDSGSGLVTIENGRAVVRGLVSYGDPTPDCLTPAAHGETFMNVFHYRDFILSTMAAEEPRFSGTVRLRKEGADVGGQMILACANRFGAMAAPLNVQGVQIGANCAPGETLTALCAITGPTEATDPRGRPLRIAITGLSMETDCPPHPKTVEDLPFAPTLASVFGLPAASPDPFGLCTQRISCRIGFKRLSPRRP